MFRVICLFNASPAKVGIQGGSQLLSRHAYHPHNDRLPSCASPALTCPPADISLIELDMADKQPPNISLLHQFANLMADPPCRLVRDAEFAL